MILGMRKEALYSNETVKFWRFSVDYLCIIFTHIAANLYLIYILITLIATIV
jgi:hypothetical protein